MATFALYGYAAVGVVAFAACLGFCLYHATIAAHRAVSALATAVTSRRRARRLEDMPGHPERVPDVGELPDDEAFWEAAQRLLKDSEEPRLAEVCEELGWLR